MNNNIKSVNITISKETAEEIIKIDERYYFDLFKEIRTSKNEEYQIREAITKIAKQIKRTNSNE